MKLKVVQFLRIFASICLLLPASTGAETITPVKEKYRFSGPHTHKNLQIYLIHGKDQLDATRILTLEAALEAKKAIVHETGDVGTLSVENTSNKYFVFIQAGDIVKGGKQDRVLSRDLVLQPKSGKVDVASFCVEQGRWQKRGGENVREFSSSKSRLSSKALKIAAISEGKQGSVWQNVSKDQEKLERKVGAPVKAHNSDTSLQLTLESENIKRKTKQYTEKLRSLARHNPNTLGYIFAINGKLNSAEIYGAHSLFEASWDKLLAASVTEAVAEYEPNFKSKIFSRKALQAFLADAEQAEVDSSRSNESFKTYENDSSVLFESKINKNAKNWIHRNYIQK